MYLTKPSDTATCCNPPCFRPPTNPHVCEHDLVNVGRRDYGHCLVAVREEPGQHSRQRLDRAVVIGRAADHASPLRGDVEDRGERVPWITFLRNHQADSRAWYSDRKPSCPYRRLRLWPKSRAFIFVGAVRGGIDNRVNGIDNREGNQVLGEDRASEESEVSHTCLCPMSVSSPEKHPPGSFRAICRSGSVGRTEKDLPFPLLRSL